MNPPVLSVPAGTTATPGAIDAWLRGRVLRSLAPLRHGELVIEDAWGRRRLGEGDGANPVHVRVADPRFYRMLALGGSVAAGEARRRAGALLERLNIPAKLWGLPPATFSGGEQQRVNLARAFVADYRVLLLDEPTASLDRANRDIVADLIREALARGVAIVGILHDEALRGSLATRELRLSPNGAAA